MNIRHPDEDPIIYDFLRSENVVDMPSKFRHLIRYGASVNPLDPEGDLQKFDYKFDDDAPLRIILEQIPQNYPSRRELIEEIFVPTEENSDQVVSKAARLPDIRKTLTSCDNHNSMLVSLIERLDVSGFETVLAQISKRPDIEILDQIKDIANNIENAYDSRALNLITKKMNKVWDDIQRRSGSLPVKYKGAMPDSIADQLGRSSYLPRFVDLAVKTMIRFVASLS